MSAAPGIGAEIWAHAVDQSFGLSAVAAIQAQPKGPARAVEAAVWVRRAQERGIDQIATLFTPGMTDDDLDAVTELHIALALAIAAAAEATA